jgi:hypothetical protein
MVDGMILSGRDIARTQEFRAAPSAISKKKIIWPMIHASAEPAAIVTSFLIAIVITQAAGMMIAKHRKKSDRDTGLGEEYGRVRAPMTSTPKERTMAKAKADETRAKRSEVSFDPVQAINGIEPILQASNKWFENWAAVSSELLEFGRSRLDRNIEVGKAIARSNSFDEAIELQADYARSTVREYFSEAGKLADIGTRAVIDTVMVWQPAMREVGRRGGAATLAAAAAS